MALPMKPISPTEKAQLRNAATAASMAKRVGRKPSTDNETKPNYRQNCIDLLTLLRVFDFKTSKECEAGLRLLASVARSINAQEANMRDEAKALIEQTDIRRRDLIEKEYGREKS